MMLGNLSSNRYWVYGALAFFSWCTFNFFAVRPCPVRAPLTSQLAIIGLALADMAVHGEWAKLQRLNFGIRLAIHAVLIGLVVLVQFINPVRNGLNNGMATLNVTYHTDLTFADLITATCIISVVELAPWVQLVLGNVVLRAIGRVTTAGLFLISAVMTFTAVPTLALSLSNNRSSPSSITGLTWLVMFVASLLLAIPFHFFVELPSKHFGERVRRSCCDRADFASSPTTSRPGARSRRPPGPSTVARRRVTVCATPSTRRRRPSAAERSRRTLAPSFHSSISIHCIYVVLANARRLRPQRQTKSEASRSCRRALTQQGLAP